MPTIPEHLPTECPHATRAGDLEQRCETPLRYREPVTDDEPLTAVCSARPDPHEWIVAGEPGREQLAVEGADGEPVFGFPSEGCPLCRSPLGPDGPGSGADPHATLLRCYGHGGHRWLVDTVAGSMRPAPPPQLEPLVDGDDGRRGIGSPGRAALQAAADELRELLVEVDRALEQLDLIAREHNHPHTSHAAGVLRDVAQVALAQQLLAVQLLAVTLERLAARPDAGERVADQRREQSYVIVLADLERRRTAADTPPDVVIAATEALQGLHRLMVEVRTAAGIAQLDRREPERRTATVVCQTCQMPAQVDFVDGEIAAVRAPCGHVAAGDDGEGLVFDDEVTS